MVQNFPRRRSVSNEVCLFFNCTILRNGILCKDDLWLSEGKVIHPHSVNFRADDRIDCGGSIVSPGFIDLQLNGAFGVDFLTCPDLKSGLDEVCRLLPSTGTSSFCPTLISSPREFYSKTLPLLGPRAGSGTAGASVLGVHLEGPFISKNKKGAHPVDCIIPPSKGFQTAEDVYGPDNLGNISLVTLAPEYERSEEVIREFVQRGVVVSLGHSECHLESAQRAVKAGATKITHLFNSMPCFHHRDPSLPGLLVADHTTPPPFFGMIADGIHTHPVALRMAHRMNPDGLILVSDAIGAMGLPAGSYKLGQTQVDVGGSPLRATVHGSPKTLAGSVASLDFCVRHFRAATLCDTQHVLRAVTLNPAKCLGITDRKGTLSVGSDADFVLLDPKTLEVRCTYIAGEVAFCSRQGKQRGFVPVSTIGSFETSTTMAESLDSSPSLSTSSSSPVSVSRHKL